MNWNNGKNSIQFSALVGYYAMSQLSFKELFSSQTLPGSSKQMIHRTVYRKMPSFTNANELEMIQNNCQLILNFVSYNLFFSSLDKINTSRSKSF